MVEGSKMILNNRKISKKFIGAIILTTKRPPFPITNNTIDMNDVMKSDLDDDFHIFIKNHQWLSLGLPTYLY
ncbi:MAG: hypothetical protein ACTSRG_09220 [Candidatus Helarchaeota archaeon]